VRLVLTENVEDTEPIVEPRGYFEIVRVKNRTPRSFAENHNRAFAHASDQDGHWFAVLNPDLRWPQPILCRLRGDVLASIAAHCQGPVTVEVRNSRGLVEDHARKWPTWRSLLRKALVNDRGTFEGSELTSREWPIAGWQVWSPDWIAGMFMLWQSDKFKELGGFDQSFWLYYEDVDICARSHMRGWRCAVVRDLYVIHDAQRRSHRSLRYLLWHLASMFRYLARYRGSLK
jgi:hypothetical protein